MCLCGGVRLMILFVRDDAMSDLHEIEMVTLSMFLQPSPLPPSLLPLSLPPSSQCNVARPPDPLQSHGRLLSVSDAKVIC